MAENVAVSKNKTRRRWKKCLQNLYYQADRWIRREAARGKSWSADGFVIRGTLIKAYRQKGDNAVKKRMDRIVTNYEIKGGKNE